MKFTSRVIKKKCCSSSSGGSNLASSACKVWSVMLVNNTPQPLGEFTPSVKNITQETHAAFLENLKFISASDSGCKRIIYFF